MMRKRLTQLIVDGQSARVHLHSRHLVMAVEVRPSI
jgi:hypothetical protein